MFNIFLIPALLAGIGVAIATAPIGCFVVWRRMAYFGDATAHAAILGIAISLVLSTNMFFGILFVTHPDGSLFLLRGLSIVEGFVGPIQLLPG